MCAEPEELTLEESLRSILKHARASGLEPRDYELAWILAKIVG